MSEQTINCPHCGKKFPLSQAVTHQIEERIQATYEKQFMEKEKKLKESLEADFEKRSKEELARKEKTIEKKIKETLKDEIDELKENNTAQEKKLKQYKSLELTMIKKEKEIEEREERIKVETEKILIKERKKIREEVKQNSDEEYKLKLSEKDKQIESLSKLAEDLKRKAEQGSMQSQGETLEIELENFLRSSFPFDSIEPVEKGKKGGDIIQSVRNENGRESGIVLWESKRTKAWSDTWIQKLKDDQRSIKAEIAIIVSEVLPKEIKRFGYYQGVWVSDLPSVLGLATALRGKLIELTQARSALIGKNEKMELVFNYLIGPEFRQRIESMSDAFKEMRSDLESERIAMEKIWSKREKQMFRVIQNMTGMYGDLNGLGASLPTVKNLELPAD